MTFVVSPRSFSISAVPPIATIRPPRTASACASGWAASPVQIFADRSTRSAEGPGAAGVATWPRREARKSASESMENKLSALSSQLSALSYRLRPLS